jgi:hypothetical protein
MSDPNYMHEFVSNAKGVCKQIVSGSYCHLPKSATVHQRFKPQENDESEIESLRTQLAEANAKADRAIKALHDLTPGGSEFIGDIDRCFEFIKARRYAIHEQFLKANAARIKVEAACAEMRYVIVANGEGSQAAVISGYDIHNAVHKFSCMCGKPWKECETNDIQMDIAMIDERDNWSTDEDGKPFSITWPHETGSLTIYHLSDPIQRPNPGSALLAQLEAADKLISCLKFHRYHQAGGQLPGLIEAYEAAKGGTKKDIAP